MNKTTLSMDKAVAYIRNNTGKVPYQKIARHLMISDARLFYLMKLIYAEKTINDIYVRLPEIERRNRYLVQLDDFCYLVHFSEAVEPKLIAYCPIKIGADYSVGPISDWEFDQLKKSIPVVYIESDFNYQYNFWYATQQFLTHE